MSHESGDGGNEGDRGRSSKGRPGQGSPWASRGTAGEGPARARGSHSAQGSGERSGGPWPARAPRAEDAPRGRGPRADTPEPQRERSERRSGEAAAPARERGPWSRGDAASAGPRREPPPRDSSSPRPRQGSERSAYGEARPGPGRERGPARRDWDTASAGQGADGRRGPRPARGDDRHGEAVATARVQRDPEQKICGLNAARAAFAARPEALRKVYLSEARIGALRELLAFCVSKRLGYRVVEDEELERISGSSHHEGVCLLMQPRPERDLQALLDALPRSGPVRLLWLDGVGNPHNLGAVLRSAAHFGAQAVLLPPQSTLGLSAAAARVAEGGAEHVPLVRLDGQGSSAEIRALEQLVEAGFVTVATLPSGAPDLYAQPLPQRAVFVLGAEGEGMQKRLVEHCERAVSIPGSGRVESLNIANAVAVLLAEHWRQHPPRSERA